MNQAGNNDIYTYRYIRLVRAERTGMVPASILGPGSLPRYDSTDKTHTHIKYISCENML